jgi:pyruvate/2-oxoglutarate dehydrogenase complex dihydrolipoamide acyltransferase (E2) component
MRMKTSQGQGVHLVLPELGLGSAPIRVGQWLVEKGREVAAGDRLLEIVAGSATVDLPAPASGILRKMFVLDDDPLMVGQVLGVIETPESDDSVSDSRPGRPL